MSPFPGPGALHQRINTVHAADFSHCINFFNPFIVRIRIILFISVFFMIIKIKYHKTTGSIWQKGIYTNHISCVKGSSLKMGDDIFFPQRLMLSELTVDALYFQPQSSRAIFLPEVIALRIISGVTTFIDRPFGVHILPSPEPGIEDIGHFFSNNLRMDNSCALIGIIFLLCLRISKTLQLPGIGNSRTIQYILQQLVFQLKFIQLLLQKAYIFYEFSHCIVTFLRGAGIFR